MNGCKSWCPGRPSNCSIVGCAAPFGWHVGACAEVRQARGRRPSELLAGGGGWAARARKPLRNVGVRRENARAPGLGRVLGRVAASGPSHAQILAASGQVRKSTPHPHPSASRQARAAQRQQPRQAVTTRTNAQNGAPATVSLARRITRSNKVGDWSPRQDCCDSLATAADLCSQQAPLSSSCLSSKTSRSSPSRTTSGTSRLMRMS